MGGVGRERGELASRPGGAWWARAFLEIEQRGVGRSFYGGVELGVSLDAGVGGGDVVVEEGFVGVEVAVEGVEGFGEDGAGEGGAAAVELHEGVGRVDGGAEGGGAFDFDGLGGAVGGGAPDAEVAGDGVVDLIGADDADVAGGVEGDGGAAGEVNAAAAVDAEGVLVGGVEDEGDVAAEGELTAVAEL